MSFPGPKFLQGRVDFHRAVYRQLGSRLPARCWITVDGEEVFNCADLDTDWRMAYLEAKSRLEREQPEADQWVLSDEAWREADSDFPRGGFLGSALHEYIAAPIANSLKSANQIVQAFAIIDRRVGRRTLERFCASPDLPPLTRLFVKLRLTSNATAHGATSAEQGIASIASRSAASGIPAISSGCGSRPSNWRARKVSRARRMMSRCAASRTTRSRPH